VLDVYLLRHAHVEYDNRSITAHNPLTPLGHEMADRLAERVVQWGVQRLYASTMRRAQETADHISQRMTDLPRVDSPAMRETCIDDLADWPGEAPSQDLRQWQDEHYAHANANMWRRVTAALDDIVCEAETEGLERVAIVSHGGPINAMVRYVLGQGIVRLRTRWLDLDWSTTCCLRYDATREGIRCWVRWVNDARHIDDLRDQL